MIVVFKVFGYALLGWIAYQPIKGLVRLIRRRKALRALGEHYTIEKRRVASQQSLGLMAQRSRRGLNFYRVEVDGFRVDILPGLRTMTYPWTWTTLSVDLGYGLPSNLSVQPHEQASLIQHLLPGQRVGSADSEFDRVHSLKGDQPELSSYLSETRRRALSALTRLGGFVKEGRLIHSYKHAIFDGDRLQKAIVELVSTARVLAVPSGETSPIPGLTANAGSDDIVSVRLQNLRYLYQYYGESTEASDLTNRLLNDPDSEIRLEAACHQPAGAEDVLLEFLQGDEDLSVRARAVRGLGGCMPDKVRDKVLELLSSTEPELRLASIHAAGSLKLNEAYEPMMSRFRATEGEEREHLATALTSLAQTGDESLEERLLDTLRDPPICAPGPIIHGLAAIGTVKAVEKLLKALAGAYGGSRHDRHAAKEAIMEIQGRATGAAAGQLSLAELEDMDGALSLQTIDDEDE